MISLQAPGRYSQLYAIRQAVVDLCTRCGLCDFKTAQLEMAVDEACSNVIEHSYGGEAAPGDDLNRTGLRINLIRAKDRIIVEIYDQGTGFDFENSATVSPPDYVDECRQRGLGMYIIRCFVDDASYRRGTPEGNCLRLTKLL
jgi:serine/threonine-protein kinase RsbW